MRFTFREASERWRVSVSTLQRWRSQGRKGVRLVTQLFGGRRIVTAEDLEAFVRKVSKAANSNPRRVRAAGRGERVDRKVGERKRQPDVELNAAEQAGERLEAVWQSKKFPKDS